MKKIAVGMLASLALVVGLLPTLADHHEEKKAEPREDEKFFNGKDLEDWEGNKKYWSVKDGQIIGFADKYIPGNEFLWSKTKVKDFYLSVHVKLTPDEANSGIQIRSHAGKGGHGHAIGYQADIGKGSWARIYEEGGRAYLDWTDEGEKHVKPNDWNHYEILAVGHRVWTAMNGHLSVAIDDPKGALEGQIAFQMHAGDPMDLKFKDIKLVHDPKVELIGMDEKELLAAIRPPVKKTTSVKPRFDLQNGDTVVFTGGTNTVLAQRQGYLESLLTRAYPGRKIHFRNMAWQADTVHHQQRPYRFGLWPKHLKDVGADVIFTSFGQSEAMAGEAGLARFVTDYEKLLDLFAANCDRMVMVSPVAFEKNEAPLPDLSVHNMALGKYVAAMRELAAQRSIPFVDLYSAREGRLKGQRLTADGLRLRSEAFPAVAAETARQLGITPYPWPELESLREGVVQKNELWFDSWRPMNWAFLGGSRTMVPFSLDAKHERRDFPEEMKQFVPLIQQAESKIYSLL